MRGGKTHIRADGLYRKHSALGVPLNVLTTIAEYYIANKPYDSDWCVLPVSNIEAYLGSSALGKQYLIKIPPELMERKQSGFGASVYKIMV